MKGKSTMSELVHTDWVRLRKQAEGEIDYSDIPETDEKFWADAELVIPERKVHLSIRLDEDIVEWFKQFGRGYQTRINAVLRSYI
ncbi:unnamed protein product, partial [marine sediment metagenome]